MLDSSCSDSVSPPSSTATSALMRSSPGSRRRSSKSACRYATNSAIWTPKRVQLVGVERRPHERVRPLAELVAVGRRDAEQLRDHRDRQRERERRHELHLAVGGDGVEQLVGDLLDPRPQLLDHPRRERLGDEPAQAPVVVAVAVEHVAVDERDRLRQARRPLGELLRRKREPRVADEALVVEQHRLGVLVARHAPDRRLAVEAGLAEDRVVLPHLRERRVRVGEEVLRCRGRTCGPRVATSPMLPRLATCWRRGCTSASLIERYNAAWNAQDLDAIHALHASGHRLRQPHRRRASRGRGGGARAHRADLRATTRRCASRRAPCAPATTSPSASGPRRPARTEWDGVDVFPLRDGLILRKDVYSSSHRPREL